MCLELDLRLQIVDLTEHSHKPWQVEMSIVPILQMEKLRPGVAK